MVDEHNQLAKSFRMARDFYESNKETNFSLRLFRSGSRDPRTYNIPKTDEVAALIIGDSDNFDEGRDVVVKRVSGVLERIHETHTDFIPLQYPLLFPYGEDGFKEDIPIRESELIKDERKRLHVTMGEFIAFRIQDRRTEFGNIVGSRRLFQKFLVDGNTMIEPRRLQYVRLNQSTIRAYVLNGLPEALTIGEIDPSVGMRIILPSSFTGGARYMFNNYQDAMAIYKKIGYPNLFITVTCNSNWNEIQRFVRSRNLKADDRPDIACRVFKMKLDQMLIKNGNLFGKVDAGMCFVSIFYIVSSF